MSPKFGKSFDSQLGFNSFGVDINYKMNTMFVTCQSTFGSLNVYLLRHTLNIHIVVPVKFDL